MFNLNDTICYFQYPSRQAEEKRDEAIEQIEKESMDVRTQKRQNRKMTKNLPVLEARS